MVSFEKLSLVAILDLLRSFEPCWVNRITADRIAGILRYADNGQMERLDQHINDAFVRPNKLPYRPVCWIDNTALVFRIPACSISSYTVTILDSIVSIAGLHDWLLGGLLARLIFDKSMIGFVNFNGYRLSYRACLIACLMGDLAGPVIDMGQDGLLEDFECDVSLREALGLWKR